jgi:predicted nucleic acid-binding protein
LIFVDSNIPMYLVGAPHPNKTDSQLILERLIASQERLVCDAEVLQEVLHRYVAIGRKDAIPQALDALLCIVDEVLPIERQDVLRAAHIVAGKSHLSARDALHISIMERYNIQRIFSFDADYDRHPGIVRIGRV